MGNSRGYRRCAAALVLSGLQFAYSVGHAQTVAPTPLTASRGVEDIVVTSQKRAQKLQKVPVTITAFSAKDIARSGITTATELSQHVPALTISVGGPGLVLPFLRGVGNNSTTIGNESSVATYLDDVYVARLSTSFLELNDISRIEVLKGPQGTLFGRNASAGVIGIFTKDPSPDYQANASFTYGNYDTATEKLYLSGAVAPGINANLSVLNSTQSEPWGRDPTSHQPLGYDDPFVVRSKWMFQLSPSTTLRLIGDYSQDRTSIGTYVNTYPGYATGSPDFYSQPPYNRKPTAFGPAGFYDALGNGKYGTNSRGFGLSARLGQDLGFAQFTSTTGYRQYQETEDSDADFSPLNGLQYDIVGHSRTFTQEFQLASKSDSAFDWIVGLFYLNEFSSYEPTEITGPGILKDVLGFPLSLPVTTPPGSTVALYGHGRVKDYAAYTQETIHLPYKTNLTVGFRYTIDDLDGGGATAINVPGFPGLENVTIPATPNTTSFDKATFKAGLDHRFTEDILGYVSFSRGFKAGTYNLLPFTVPATRPEVIDAYEVGGKSTLLDHKLQLNASLFYYDYKDPQVQEIVNRLVFLANAKTAEVKGAEFQGQYVVTPELSARFGGSYIDSHYTNFPNAPFFAANTNPPYGIVTFAGVADGHELPNSPKFAANAGADYSVDLPYGRFDFDANYAFTGSFRWNPDNVLRQKSYSLVDASLTYRLPDNDRWALRLWGKNILGKKYAISAAEISGAPGFFYGPGAPATYGFTLSFNFGK